MKDAVTDVARCRNLYPKYFDGNLLKLFKKFILQLKSLEDGTQARVLKIFSSGADAVKTREEILETYKDLDQPTLETCLDNLVSSGKLAQKEFGGISVYWLVSEFTCAAKGTPPTAPLTPHRSSGDVRRGVRRPFVSPVMTSAKKMHLEEDQVVRRQSTSTPSSSNKELLVERRQLMEKIKEKEVKLQQLKNADEMEKSGELDKLIKKWRETSQQAAEQLLMKAQGQPPPTMGEMLRHLHIDPKLIQYNEEDECFY